MREYHGMGAASGTRRHGPQAIRRCALVVALAACGSDEPVSAAARLARESEAGRYVAMSYRGRSLPVVTDSGPHGFGVLLADTLELDGRGGARRSYAVRRAPATAEGGVHHVVERTRYRAEGARISLGTADQCGPAELCLANDSGRVAGAELRLETSRYGTGGVVVLTRRE